MKNHRMRQELVQLGGGAHALAIQLLGNADDAADAVHDALATALGKPEAYDAEKGALKPWFLTVVRNRCLDLLRRRRATDDRIDELASSLDGPVEMAEKAERDHLLQTALNALRAEQREIIILRDYLDLSYAEIADVLDIAQGTVMSKLHRARVALGEAYRENEQDD